MLAKFGKFSWRDNLSYRLYTLGPLCLWQCFCICLLTYVDIRNTDQLSWAINYISATWYFHHLFDQAKETFLFVSAALSALTNERLQRVIILICNNIKITIH